MWARDTPMFAKVQIRQTKLMQKDAKVLLGAFIGAAILSLGTFVFLRQSSAPTETPVSPLTQTLHKHLRNIRPLAKVIYEDWRWPQ